MEEKYYEILRHYVNPNDCAKVVKQLLSLHNVVVPKGTLCKCKKEFIVYNDREGLNVCTLCGKSELA